MIMLKLRFIPATAVLSALASLTNVYCENSAEVAESERKMRPGDYWSMATITNALTPVSDLFAPPTCSPHPLERVFQNPDFAPLFEELPDLKSELEEIAPGDQSNAEFLFKVYVSLSPTVTPFFHRAISQMTSAVPKIRDLTKFNIAAELSTYVQSIIDPIPNLFSEIAKYKLEPSKKSGFKVPSQREIKNVVGRVVLKNVGAPPLIPFLRLHTQLSILVKSYVERQRHNFSSNHGNNSISSQDDTRVPEENEARLHLQRLKVPSKLFEKISGIIIKLAT